jgi:hypothetical protein
LQLQVETLEDRLLLTAVAIQSVDSEGTDGMVVVSDIDPSQNNPSPSSLATTSASRFLADSNAVGRKFSAQLKFRGTVGNDVFRIVDLSTMISVSINGQNYVVLPNANGKKNLKLDGLAGKDKIVVLSGDGDNRVRITPRTIDVNSTLTSISARNVEDIRVFAEKGTDNVNFFDSAGDDQLVVKTSRATQTGKRYAMRAIGFESVKATARNGKDTAILHDSVGKDFFVAKPKISVMRGNGFSFAVKGFDRVSAHASNGFDSAKFTGTNGNDKFVGKEKTSSMKGVRYSYVARHFETVVAFGLTGTDLAQLNDSHGNDRFFGDRAASRLVGGKFSYKANGFEKVRAFASKGIDKARLRDTATADFFVGRSNKSRLNWKGNQVLLNAFDKVYVKATLGGNDEAKLFGSKSNDRFIGSPTRSTLIGKTFFIDVKGFDVVKADAGRGKKDIVLLEGSSLADKFLGRGTIGSLSGPGFVLFTNNFDRIRAQGKQGPDVLDARKLKYHLTPISFETVLPLAALTTVSQDNQSHLFIFSGQSNMVGMNPEVGFKTEASRLFPDADVAYIKVAAGGMPIRYWVKEWNNIAESHGIDSLSVRANDEHKGTVYYQPILNQFRELLAQHPNPASVTFCWMQGERDAKYMVYPAYGDALRRLITNLRRDLKRPKMQFVIGRLSDYGKASDVPWQAIRQVQVNIAENDALGAWVDTDDLNNTQSNGVAINDLHYTQKGYELLGLRFFRQAKALIEGKQPAKNGRP